MAKFNFERKVPKGYMYPLSIREAKEFAKHNKNISSISYTGISPHDQIKAVSNVEFWLGNVHLKKESNELNFSLGLYASNKECMTPVISEIKDLLVSETNLWISMQLELPEPFYDGPNTLYISVIVENGTLKSTSREYKKTK